MARMRVLGCMAGAAVCMLAVMLTHQLQLLGASSSVDVRLTVLGYDDDTDPPYVEDMSPASGATLVPTGGAITLRIKDYRNNDGVTAGSGVDLSTVQITLWYASTDSTYVDGDAEFSATGSTVNRLITINPAADLPYDTRITVSVRASDLHVPPNVMSVFRYSFRTEPAPSATPATTTHTDDPNGGHRGEHDPQIHGSLGSGDVLETVRDRCFPGNEIIEGILPQVGDFWGCMYMGRRTPFPDVPHNAWYEDALVHFLRMGVIDAAQPLFRPADGTLRAEVATVLVRIAGISSPRTPAVSSFVDVQLSSWYYGYVEEAAAQGWMLGYGDCFGVRRPCEDRPEQPITRAEAAKMIVRAYGLQPLDLAPAFPDMPPYAWYLEPVSTAADYCIIQGDGVAHMAWPERTITRAELVTMLFRAEQQLRYGRDCSRGSPFAGMLGGEGAVTYTLAQLSLFVGGAGSMAVVAAASQYRRRTLKTVLRSRRAVAQKMRRTRRKKLA